MAETHVSDVRGTMRVATAHPTSPTPRLGDEYFNTSTHSWCGFDGTQWYCVQGSTTSTSTTTSTSSSTSTSVTTTSSSTSTTTSISTSTSTTG